MFDLKSIHIAKNLQKIVAIKKSKQTYFAEYENSFQVLSDHESIIGIGFDRQSLIIEKLGSQASQETIYKHKETICCITQNQGSLLVGSSASSIFQYKFSKSQKKWIPKESYKDPELGEIRSMAQLGNLAVVGGNKQKLRLIDLKKRNFLGKSLKCAIKYISSLQICRLSASSVVLTSSGTSPNYENGRTDVFDLSEAIKKGLVGEYVPPIPSVLMEEHRSTIKKLQDQLSQAKKEIKQERKTVDLLLKERIKFQNILNQLKKWKKKESKKSKSRDLKIQKLSKDLLRMKENIESKQKVFEKVKDENERLKEQIWDLTKYGKDSWSLYVQESKKWRWRRKLVLKRCDFNDSSFNENDSLKLVLAEKFVNDCETEKTRLNNKVDRLRKKNKKYKNQNNEFKSQIKQIQEESVLSSCKLSKDFLESKVVKDCLNW